ncbi:MAG TPA: hypothetical protein VGK36_08905 [Candidatus Angelobacter sp.]|jgi:hypothetical protein
MNQLVTQVSTWYKTLPKWAQGAITAAEGGAAGFLAQWAISQQPLCLSRGCLKQFGAALIASMVIAVRNWLKQSPIVTAPPEGKQ